MSKKVVDLNDSQERELSKPGGPDPDWVPPPDPTVEVPDKPKEKPAKG